MLELNLTYLVSDEVIHIVQSFYAFLGSFSINLFNIFARFSLNVHLLYFVNFLYSLCVLSAHSLQNCQALIV